MVISYNWIKEYLPEVIAPEKLSQILTSIGLEVEAMEPVEFVKGSLEGLVIGEVLTCEKHPDADRLKVTTVNVGSGEPLNIVCGAANVAAGQKVVVAPVGATVHPMSGDSFLIKKAKIRGQASEGMICAEDEISLGESHDGIMVLPDAAMPGTLANKYFDIPEPDIAIHIGLTPNRSDAMSHIGVAKDVAAYMSYHNKKVHKTKYPNLELPVAKNKDNKITVEVKNTEACPRYMGITISNVKVSPSPDWLQRRLKAMGARPINNVVDITNYVLHEWGQPLHAFDADKITGNKVVIQTLPEGTKFVTLDEEERTLAANDLMICNDTEGICIAGVFGGMGSGVTENTTTVFLESAYFNPSYIRRTSLHHGLRTDAATHFEKGVDVNNLEAALIRATQMICELAGGVVASEIIDVYPEKIKPVEVAVKYDYINKLSGKEYDVASLKLLFISLGFGIVNESNDGITLSVPTNKSDVLQATDIVEEVVRIDGLDKIPMPERLNISLSTPLPNDRAMREKIAERLAGEGFMEILTNSIVNSKHYPERTDLVKMLNSLSSELDVMRPSMLESGLEVVQYNCNRKNTDLRLFEFGKVYTNNEGIYAEEAILAIFATGMLQDKQWNVKEVNSDIYYLKGVVDNILTYLGVDKVKYSYVDNKTVYNRKKKTLCTIEAVDAKKLYDFDIKQPVYFASVNWDACMEAGKNNKVEYTEVPKHPAVHRDLAIVLDKAVTYEQVQAVTDKVNVEGLQEYGLFDVFESEKLGVDKKSFALNFIFQPKDRTLTDEETDKLMQQLADAYKKELQAQIRE